MGRRQRGVGRFLVLEQGRGIPTARSGTQSIMGFAVWGRRVLRVQGLRGLQADATAAATQQSQILKPIWASASSSSAQADSATAVYLTKVKLKESRLGRNVGVEG